MRLPFILLGFSIVAIMIVGGRAQGSDSSKSVLLTCPNSPNCVSSRASEGPRKMDPIGYKGSVEDARQRVLEIVRSFPRVAVVESSGNYLKVEVRSAIFYFIDDVEFEFDDAPKLVHFRSASRLGYYDFGVNRRRMEAIIRKISGK
jgi:uncharacterized protein (DUF1499 family)